MIPPNEARQFAATAHEGQVDKNGRDYLEHLREVAEYVKEAGGTEEEIAAAWLHDIVEDTDANFILLEGIGLSRRQLAIIWAVTKQEGESYPDYLHRLRGTPGATELKLADIKSNTPARAPGDIAEGRPGTAHGQVCQRRGDSHRSGVIAGPGRAHPFHPCRAAREKAGLSHPFPTIPSMVRTGRRKR